MYSNRYRFSVCCSDLHSTILPFRSYLAAATRSRGLRQSRHTLALTLSPKRLALLGSIARIITVVALSVVPITASFHPETAAFARGLSPVETLDQLANFIEQASNRFAVPSDWIRAVIQIESAGDGHAISPRGAMGLMQLMPSTWSSAIVMVLAWTRLILATIYWLAPPISNRCTTALDR